MVKKPKGSDCAQPFKPLKASREKVTVKGTLQLRVVEVWLRSKRKRKRLEGKLYPIGTIAYMVV
jgi:hypothetical protein